MKSGTGFWFRRVCPVWHLPYKMHVCQVGRACVSSLEPIASAADTCVQVDSTLGPVGPDSDCSLTHCFVSLFSPVFWVSLDASNANIRDEATCNVWWGHYGEDHLLNDRAFSKCSHFPTLLLCCEWWKLSEGCGKWMERLDNGWQISAFNNWQWEVQKV